jgi:hypothetical protein
VLERGDRRALGPETEEVLVAADDVIEHVVARDDIEHFTV